MKTCFVYFFIFTATFAANVASLFAESIIPIDLTGKQIEELKDIEEQYIRYVSTKSRFVQVDNLGNRATGWFVIQKPKQARIEYDKLPLRFIINGNTFMLQNLELKQKTFLPANYSPFIYLLNSDSLFFNEDVQIINFIKKMKYTEITINNKDNPELGTLTLLFSPNNDKLLKWKIKDVQGMTTEVLLLSPLFMTEDIKNRRVFDTQRVVDIEFIDIS